MINRFVSFSIKKWPEGERPRDIPLRDIERRFPRSLHNLLNDFSHRVDRCICFMNDGETPVLVFEQDGETRDVLHEDYYQSLQKEAAV